MNQITEILFGENVSKKFPIVEKILMIQNNGMSPEFIQLLTGEMKTLHIYGAIDVPGFSLEGKNECGRKFILKFLPTQKEFLLNQVVRIQGKIVEETLERKKKTFVIHVEKCEEFDIEKSLVDASPNNNLIRNELLDFISLVIGDHLLSEYLLLHLVSKARDSLSLSLTRVKNNISPLLQLLSILLPKVVNLDLSIENLNAKSFLPNFSDILPENEEEEEKEGILQLSNHTYVTINEGCLDAGGVLNETGIMNLRALKLLSERHECLYNINGYNLVVPTDVNLIILRESDKGLSINGGEEIISTKLVVPLINGSLYCETFPDLPDPEKLAQFKGYLQRSRFQKMDDNQPLHEYIVEEFVNDRKNSSVAAEIDAQHLSFKISLAKLLAFSLGKTQIDLDIWNKVKLMEKERLSRFNEKIGH
jgi:hypothetical protein